MVSVKIRIVAKWNNIMSNHAELPVAINVEGTIFFKKKLR